MSPRGERQPKPLATPKQIAELDQKRRRGAMLRAVTRIAFAWTLLTVVYFVAPWDGLHGGDALVRLVISMSVFAAAAAWELRQTTRAELPQFRAITALGALTPLFIILFSGLYLSLSHSRPESFTTRLDHYKALYFMITTLSTVGYGDITPTTNLSRMLVSVQMLLDLILIGSIVRLLASAAQKGLQRDGVAPGPILASEVASEPPPATDT
jgi:hypothetical protein